MLFKYSQRRSGGDGQWWRWLQLQCDFHWTPR